MTRYAFAIDLHRCAGCGSCILGCKSENNVPDGLFWAYHITETIGVFPQTTYRYIPTLCNHCDEAPCVAVCPVTPKVMHKDASGLTLHDAERCIGCRRCLFACPYGVISYNAEEPHPFWRQDKPLIPGCTSAPSEVAPRVGSTLLPYYVPDRAATYPGVRPKGVVEKCTGCDHRLLVGLLPRCVETCPAKARIFGDLDDTSSAVRRMARDPSARVLKEEAGTKPHVFYIREHSPR